MEIGRLFQGYRPKKGKPVEGTNTCNGITKIVPLIYPSKTTPRKPSTDSSTHLPKSPSMPQVNELHHSKEQPFK
jgi:hypothetical protein